MAPLSIVIAGSSGFLGTHLRAELESRGHHLTSLVRRPAATPHESTWDPASGQIDDAVVREADVVVCLNGSRLLGNPHSRRYRDRIRSSRVAPTRVLAEAIARTGGASAFVAQNASAWYGDHGDTLLTEEADTRGHAFMTEVARTWQDATRPASDAGSRVCLLRTVPVMAVGALTYDVLVPVFRLGLGARLGSGRHWFPVISLRDWVRAASYLVEHPTASGPVNMTCPEPPTNAGFTDAFAASLGRRARLAVPAPLLRVGAGALAPEVLGSFRLVPDRLESLGFSFRDRDVDAVLEAGREA